MNTDFLSPADRLSQSREQLRQALLGDPRAKGAGPERTASARHASWLATLRALPGLGVLVDAVEQWWSRHPLRVATVIASTAATAVVTPIAQRHPLRLVLGAAVFGGLLTWARPWRWVVVPALFAGLAPQLLSAALRLPQAASDRHPKR